MPIEQDNPLASDSPRAWDQLIDSVGPASLLLVIESRMSDGLRRHTSAEDILQESLMHAWRDRHQFAWSGAKAFRAWLLTIIDNRIREAADHAGAQKRGGGAATLRSSELSVSAGASASWGPVGSTTPSRIAIYREQCAAMRAALDALSPEVTEVVRLRLFEQLSMEDVAQQVGIGLSAAWHRFRKGAEEYHQLLTARLASHPSDALHTTSAEVKSS